MRKPRPNTKSASARWCATPCPRFVPAEPDSGPSRTLADQIARSKGALTAYELAELLSVSAISIFRLAKRGVIPAFRVGTSLRFCPAAISKWLKERGG